MYLKPFRSDNMLLLMFMEVMIFGLKLL